MELRQYWDILRRWFWLVVLTAVVAGLAAFFFSMRQTPIYEARTRLLVTQGSEGSTDLFGANTKLTSTFAQVLASESMLEVAVEKVGLVGVDIKDLSQDVSVQPLRDTQLIDLTVRFRSPTLAAELANMLPVVFADFYSQQQSARFQETKNALQEALAGLDVQARQLEAELQALESSNSADDMIKRNLLSNQLAQVQNNYSDTLSQLQEIQLTEAKSLDTLAVVDPAKPDADPVSPRVLFNTLLATIVGAMIGLGAAFLIEYLDDTVKTPDHVATLTGYAPLGVIDSDREGENGGLVALESPRSPSAEAYRVIRTNIQFHSVDNLVRSLVVTSAGPGEGKSTTVANLAVVMAQAGNKVVLVDADLRKPTQHLRWKVPNTVGLTGALLLGDFEDNLDGLLSDTQIENLKVVTSGQLPPNPSELLGSQRLQQFLDRLLEDYDIVILDAPPALAVTDPAVLGRKVDGVILVVDATSTREPALMQTLLELGKAKAPLMGIVLNRFRSRKAGGYYYYKAYQGYYEQDDAGGRGDGTPETANQPAPQSGGFSQRFRRAFSRR